MTKISVNSGSEVSKQIKTVRFAEATATTDLSDLKDHSCHMERHDDLRQDTDYKSTNDTHEQERVSHDGDSELSEMDEGGMKKLSIDIDEEDWVTIGGSVVSRSD